MSGIATFQDGFPLALTATAANVPGFGRRPNVVPAVIRNQRVGPVAAERLVQRLVLLGSGRLHAGE